MKSQGRSVSGHWYCHIVNVPGILTTGDKAGFDVVTLLALSYYVTDIGRY